MTDIAVKLDPETGAATIELRGASVAEPRFRLRDIATEKFLTRRGWSKTPSFLPGESVTAADFTVLVLDAELARRVTPGMNLSLEQPASNIFATLSWPQAAGASEEEETADLSAKQKFEAGAKRNRRHVWVTEGDKLRAIPVVMGISDSRFTEVVSGELTEGQTLVTGIKPPT